MVKKPEKPAIREAPPPPVMSTVVWRPGVSHPAIVGTTRAVRHGMDGGMQECAIVKTRHGVVACFAGQTIESDGEGGTKVTEGDKEHVPHG